MRIANSKEFIFFKNNYNFKIYNILKIFIIIQFVLNIFLLFKVRRNTYNEFDKKEIKNNFEYLNNQKLEEIDENILLQIEDRLEGAIEMVPGERRFLNGLVRKYKPKKIVEIGVSAGGSAALILNAIKDIPGAKLYSIDRSEHYYKNTSRNVGWLVKERFPELMDNWTLYAGNNTIEIIENIGDNIEFVLIDTCHTTPGEMLNFLEILPFLKEKAIVAFHDVYIMFNIEFYKRRVINYSNNQLLCYIRGKLILPTYGNNTFGRNIGALQLDVNQKKYYKQYFLALGNQWNYFPDYDIIILRKYFKKYYSDELIQIFNDAVDQNLERFRKHR